MIDWLGMPLGKPQVENIIFEDANNALASRSLPSTYYIAPTVSIPRWSLQLTTPTLPRRAHARQANPVKATSRRTRQCLAQTTHPARHGTAQYYASQARYFTCETSGTSHRPRDRRLSADQSGLAGWRVLVVHPAAGWHFRIALFLGVDDCTVVWTIPDAGYQFAIYPVRSLIQNPQCASSSCPLKHTTPSRDTSADLCCTARCGAWSSRYTPYVSCARGRDCMWGNTPDGCRAPWETGG